MAADSPNKKIRYVLVDFFCSKSKWRHCASDGRREEAGTEFLIRHIKILSVNPDSAEETGIVAISPQTQSKFNAAQNEQGA